MSKERELLEELSNKDMVNYYYPELINRIKELLAQPEPEPVAWCIESKNSADWCFAKDKIGVIENEKLLDEDCDRSDPFPLYTSPLTREPLSNIVIREFANPEYIVCNAAFISGVRWAEQQHGIGDE